MGLVSSSLYWPEMDQAGQRHADGLAGQASDLVLGAVELVAGFSDG